MKSLKLTVKGRVQKVGYRSLVDEIAFALGVSGYVKNLENKTVEIVAEHEDEKILEQFTQLIKINEFPIRVNEIITEKITPKKYSDFEVFEASLEIENRESLEAGAVYMRKLSSSMNKMNDEQKKMTDEQKKMTDEQKKMTNEQKLMRTELGQKIDQTNLKLDSFSSATTDRFDIVDTKYGKISDRLERICVSLEELVGILRVFKPQV
jgi:acylphosphatase